MGSAAGVSVREGVHAGATHPTFSIVEPKKQATKPSRATATVKASAFAPMRPQTLSSAELKIDHE